MNLRWRWKNKFFNTSFQDLRPAGALKCFVQFGICVIHGNINFFARSTTKSYEKLHFGIYFLNIFDYALV
jgi:hypothetical protein